MPLVLWLPMCEWKVPIFNHMLKQEKATNYGNILIISSAYAVYSYITVSQTTFPPLYLQLFRLLKEILKS